MDEEPRDPRFAAFAWLWAAALLVHEGHLGRWLRSPLDLGLAVGAALVLLRPTSTARLAALAALQLACFWSELPLVYNHWLLAALASASLLGTFPRARRSAASWFAAFAPPLRLTLVVVYAWSAFHKLNRDFLDPAVSCAGEFLDRLDRDLPLPSGLHFPAPLLVVAMEALLPVLLVLRRTRLAGIFLGSWFHLLLGLLYHFDFSALIVALYVPFLPREALQALAAPPGMAGMARAWRRIAAAWESRLALLLVAAGLLTAALVPFRTGAHPEWSHRTAKVAWLLLETAWLPALAILLLRGAARGGGEAGALRGPVPAGYLGPLLALAAGASPYLGLGTENAFSMFSNLRTEGGRSNHLLVPASWQPFDYQRDLVGVAGCSIPLQGLPAGRGRIPRIALRRALHAAREAGARDVAIALEGAGASQLIDGAEQHPDLAAPPPYLAGKLLAFRPVPREDRPARCAH